MAQYARGIIPKCQSGTVVKNVIFTENVKYAVEAACSSISVDLVCLDKISCFSDIKIISRLFFNQPESYFSKADTF